MSTQNIFDLTDTWNNVGTTFTAVKMNVTDTASAAGSLLMDLQVGGVSRLTVSKAGILTRNPGTFQTVLENARIIVAAPAGTAPNLFLTQTGITAANLLVEANSGIYVLTGIAISEQRDGATTQTFRLYRTHTSNTNYQRLTITSASTTLTGLSGASVTATNLIPAGAVVVGVTTRVSTAITGATGYQVGTALDPDRWGDKAGTAIGTTTDNRDWTAGTIECFTAATSVVITAKTANFTDGAMLVTVHYLAGEAD